MIVTPRRRAARTRTDAGEDSRGEVIALNSAAILLRFLVPPLLEIEAGSGSDCRHPCRSGANPCSEMSKPNAGASARRRRGDRCVTMLPSTSKRGGRAAELDWTSADT